MLAADYVRTNTDLATMEGANEAARRAVNAILDAGGSRAPRCEVWPLREPQALAPARKLDALLWRLLRRRRRAGSGRLRGRAGDARRRAAQPALARAARPPGGLRADAGEARRRRARFEPLETVGLDRPERAGAVDALLRGPGDERRAVNVVASTPGEVDLGERRPAGVVGLGGDPRAPARRRARARARRATPRRARPTNCIAGRRPGTRRTNCADQRPRLQRSRQRAEPARGRR